MLRLSTIGIAVIGMALASPPAFATNQIPIPEPTSLGLIGAGIAGAVIAWRIYRKR